MFVKLCHAKSMLNPKVSYKVRLMLVMIYNGPTMALLSLSQNIKNLTKEFTIIFQLLSLVTNIHPPRRDDVFSNANKNSKTKDCHHLFWVSTLSILFLKFFSFFKQVSIMTWWAY